MRLLYPFFLAAVLAAAEPGPVVLLSLDGLSARHFTQATMPRIWRLGEKGFRGEGIPPFPCTTFNGHATLATGCWPGHHGIVGNAYVDPARGHVSYSGVAEQFQREPLWVAATRSGVRTAVYHWVGATGPWEQVAPWRMEPFAPDTRDEDGLAFVDRALEDGARLVMAYLSGIDTEAHQKGPGAAETQAKLKATDALLGPWLEQLLAKRPGIRVVLAADHGMARMTRRVDLPGLLEDLGATVVSHGGSAYVYLKEAGPASEVLRRARASGLRAWTRQDLPAEFHGERHPRIGDVVVLAPVGTWVSQGRSPEAKAAERAGRVGAHGYNGQPTEMHTWLVVLGAGQGHLGALPLWDLAPTIAQWLGFGFQQPPDGKPVAVLAP
ncbi:MAG: alkaline phosphatase family protein [Acidobacteria bacterium]|nr:alkaline phosphatase family protein [Acidobacteriota bacterium]